MKAIARLKNGLEEIGITTIKNTIKAKAAILQPGVLTFTTTKANLNKLIKNPQCFQYIYELKSTLSTTNLISELKKIDFSDIKPPFKVSCRKKRGGEFHSMDIEKELGEFIYTKYKTAVDLISPKTIILIEIVQNKVYLGITNTQEKLSKREYRIKTNVQSIPGDLANALLTFAEWNKNEILLDPCCTTGEILIEAALADGKKLFGLDSNPYNIKKSKFNAKVAEIDAKIKFIQREMDWLETEFKKNSIDKIITSIPIPSKFAPQSEIKKLYQELFHQAKDILNSKGNLTLITTKPTLLENIPEKEGFAIEKEIQVLSGDKLYKIIRFKK